MSQGINNQYDFFKKVNLDANGNIGVILSGGTSGGSSQPFAFTADNYTDLQAVTGMTDGDLAYVVNAQGTQWLPGTIGGSYYPNGIYIYATGTWTSDRNAIAYQLHLDDERIDALEANEFANIILVNQSNVATTLGGTIDSTKEYFIDGKIDMGTTQIEVPAGGFSYAGYNFDVSGLYSTEDNYTMFVSPVGGSGNVIGRDIEIKTSGANSQVYNLTDATGFNAFEFARINYIDCTSLGEITNYRQGLENGTGRFGGSPSLTLSGTWLGGFKITTSIVRSMSDTTTEPLFKAGPAFTMASRFATDANIDLGDLQPLLDFTPSNFPNAGTLQLQKMEVTRGGVYDAEDTNITPNITQEDLASYWKQNNGLPNTFVGGTISVVSEVLTVIGAVSTWYTLEGIFLGTGLQHFSSTADGRLTHLGNSPREFEFTASLALDSNPNIELSVRYMKYDASAGTTSPLVYTTQTRQVNNLVGGRDVAFFTSIFGGILDQNDYIYLEVRNNSGSNNITLENNSYVRIQER